MPAKKQLLSKYKGKQVKIIDRHLTSTFEGKLVDFDHQFALIETKEGYELLANLSEVIGLREVINEPT